jgi:hypothetical protein
MGKYRSSSLDRRIALYPHPKVHLLFKAFVYENDMSGSEGAEMMVKTFLESLPEDKKEAMMKRYMISLREKASE